MSPRTLGVLGAVLAAAGVLLGALHAHGLERWLFEAGVGPDQVPRYMDNADVAIRYQLIHAVGFLALSALMARHPSRLLSAGMWLLVIGLTLFSGGLYLIVLLGTAIHWAIVPSGGLIMIIAWLLVALALAATRHSDAPQGTKGTWETKA